jgi:hypothetical protein
MSRSLSRNCFPDQKALRKATEKGGVDNIFSTYFSSCLGDSPPYPNRQVIAPGRISTRATIDPVAGGGGPRSNQSIKSSLYGATHGTLHSCMKFANAKHYNLEAHFRSVQLNRRSDMASVKSRIQTGLRRY